MELQDLVNKINQLFHNGDYQVEEGVIEELAPPDFIDETDEKSDRSGSLMESEDVQNIIRKPSDNYLEFEINRKINMINTDSL